MRRGRSCAAVLILYFVSLSTAAVRGSVEVLSLVKVFFVTAAVFLVMVAVLAGRWHGELRRGERGDSLVQVKHVQCELCYSLVKEVGCAQGTRLVEEAMGGAESISVPRTNGGEVVEKLQSR